MNIDTCTMASQIDNVFALARKVRARAASEKKGQSMTQEEIETLIRETLEALPPEPTTEELVRRYLGDGE